MQKHCHQPLMQLWFEVSDTLLEQDVSHMVWQEGNGAVQQLIAVTSFRPCVVRHSSHIKAGASTGFRAAGGPNPRAGGPPCSTCARKPGKNHNINTKFCSGTREMCEVRAQRRWCFFFGWEKMEKLVNMGIWCYLSVSATCFRLKFGKITHNGSLIGHDSSLET